MKSSIDCDRLPELPNQNWDDALSTVSVLKSEENVGVLHKLRLVQAPFIYFHLFFFTCEMMNIAKQTILYASQPSGHSKETVMGCIICKVHLCKGHSLAQFHVELH